MCRILLTGDFCPIGPVEQMVLDGDVGRISSIFEDVLSVAKECDYRVVNLECPLTRIDAPIAKTGPNLKADRKTAALLTNLGVDLVAMANNHIYDQGHQGLKDTLETCRKHGIATVGAGETLAEAQQFHLATIGSKRVAFVNFTENEFGNAEVDRGGANPLDIIDNTRQIRAARQQADTVIVIIHGGHEHFHYPSPRMVKTYRFFAEQGASMIIGHHPHCISGYEVHQGVPIFYSLGNFLFCGTTTFSGWYEGYMVELQLAGCGTCSFAIHPYSQFRDGVAVHRLADERASVFRSQLAGLCDVIQDERRLAEVWEDYARKKSKSYFYAACTRNRWLLGLCNRLGLLNCFVARSRLANLQNLITCESHRDLLVRALRSGPDQRASQ